MERKQGNLKLIEEASAMYGKDIVDQVGTDYSETVGRQASEATFHRLIYEMSGIYHLQERLDGHYPYGNYEMAKSILEDVAIGEGAGLVMHYEHDFSALSKRLKESITKTELNLSAVICPDWGWHMEGSTLVYDMDVLGNGVSRTAIRTHEYLATIAQRANNLQRPVKFNAIFSGWELTRQDFFPGINQGITKTEALELLTETTHKTKKLFTELDSPFLTTNIAAAAPQDFHDVAAVRTEKILKNAQNHQRLDAVISGRQGFYNGDLTREVAALELAEAVVAFELASEGHQNILIVPTSPTIARAAMTGQEKPWIQLKHGYRG